MQLYHLIFQRKNIEIVTKQLEKALKDIESLKDKVRANGNGHGWDSSCITNDC